MKNKFKKFLRISLLPLAIVGIAIALFSFKKEKNTFSMKTPIAYSLNFSVQKTITTSYENSWGTAYEGVQPVSESENKSYEIQVSQSGELSMTIRDLSPTNECVVTKLQNNTMTLYNAYGGVLQQIQLDPNTLDLGSLTSMVTMADKNAFLSEISNIQNGLGAASSSGSYSQVISMGMNTVKVQSAESEMMIDTQNGLVLESKTLENGTLIAETSYNSSRDASGAYILNSTQENSYDAIPNSSGRVVTSVSSNYTNFRLAQN